MRWVLIAALGIFPALTAGAQAPAASDKDKDKETTVLQQRLQELGAENQRLLAELAQMRKNVAQAALFDQRNQQLEQHVVELERELQLVQQQNQTLRDGTEQGWFLRGAGVLLLGLVLGVLIPQLNRRKAPRWGDL